MKRPASVPVMRAFLFFGLLALGAARAVGRQANPRVYLPNIADEDWSFLKDPAGKSDFWDPIKYIRLRRDDWYMSLSGEIRYRSELFRIRGVGERPSLRDDYFLQRYFVGADLHMGRRFRLYGEFQSGIISGKLKTPRPSDENPGDIHQFFVEWKETIGAKGQVGLRVGRQELNIGTSRLISASPGLNVKRSFDGARISYRSSSWRIVGSVARLVSIKDRLFDDRPDHEQTFWGIAASRKSPRFKQGELGFYSSLARISAALILLTLPRTAAGRSRNGNRFSQYGVSGRHTYDAANKNYTLAAYVSDGLIQHGTVTVSGNTWSAKGIVISGGKQYQWRGTDILSADLMADTYTAEISTDGKTWLP